MIRTVLELVDSTIWGTNTDIKELSLEVSPEDLESFKMKIFHDIEEDKILVLSGNIPSNVSKDIYGEKFKNVVDIDVA